MSEKISAVIIDDEELAIETLQWQLKEFCPDIELKKSFTNPLKAISYLSENDVDICFLDIDMPELSGFEFLEEFRQINFDIIFTTAYSEYAIKAFKVSAFDYLLKPIDEEDLVNTINKYLKKNKNKTHQRLELLMDTIQNQNSHSDRIALPTAEGIHLVEAEKIMYLKADRNYTSFYIENSDKIVVSRTIKEMHELMNPSQFLRTHKSFVVNLNFIEMYQRGGGGSIILKNGKLIPVSRRKKDEVLSFLNYS